MSTARLTGMMNFVDYIAYLDSFPEDVKNELLRRIDEANDGCIDNERIARVGDLEQEREYEDRKSNGCCGADDNEFIGADGHTYMIGFNYGH
jgi:hypothetical protein